MAESYFWTDYGPGLLKVGAGLLGNRETRREQDQRAQTTRGPLYDQQIGLASDSYSQARGANPQDFAAQRFAAQQALVAPGNEAEQQDLFRKLQAKGLLGVSSFGAVPGTQQTPGVAVNPYMAALAAGQAGAKAQSAYQSLSEGETYLNNLLSRGTSLGQAANQGLMARAAPSVQEVIAPSRPSTRSKILTGLAKNAPALIGQIPQLARSVGGLFSGLGGWFGTSAAAAPVFDAGYEDSFDPPAPAAEFDWSAFY